jgi:ribulose-phosphate 3-epimerase
MPKSLIISASILSADFACLKDQIDQVEQAGVDWLHIDVMDGHFVPNLTMGPFIVEACRRISNLPIDVHLMMEKPENLLKEYIEAGANQLYVHVETCPHLHRTIQSIQEAGCKAGVVLNPGTPASAIEAVLPMVDGVLVMTVNPGFSGQTYLPEVTPKITQVRKMLDIHNPPAFIAIDGGIDTTTLPVAASAGANFFIASSAIFKHPEGIAKGLTQLQASFPVLQG